MNEIEYVFGTGDGRVHVWTSEADLELAGPGAADAVRLDFDGDGLADDAMWDTTGSGIADVAALDLDDDGVLDHFYTDPTGSGTWDHHVTGAASDAVSEPLGWIVRTDHVDAEPYAEHRAAQQHPAADCLPDSDADQSPPTAHPSSITDAPPSHRPPDDLPGHLFQWLSRAGGHVDDDPMIA
ncbi:hypothetical protein [Nocardia tenerifensis]|nr:hypothetical protein [Nocardia tenerifensis]